MYLQEIRSHLNVLSVTEVISGCIQFLILCQRHFYTDTFLLNRTGSPRWQPISDTFSLRNVSDVTDSALIPCLASSVRSQSLFPTKSNRSTLKNLNFSVMIGLLEKKSPYMINGSSWNLDSQTSSFSCPLCGV